MAQKKAAWIPLKEKKTRISQGARRDRILTAACALFAEYGYDTVTMRQLAAAADCSPALIYKHFDSMDAIFDALVEEWKAASARPAKITVQEHSALYTLRQLYDSLHKQRYERHTEQETRPGLGKAVLNRQGPIHEELMAYLRHSASTGGDIVETALVPVIEFGKMIGEITSSQDSYILAQTFWTLNYGSTQLCELFPDTYKPLSFDDIQYIFK